MSSPQITMTFVDLESEAYSERPFGYFWTTIIEEVVKHVCMTKSFPPQSWGFPGYGPTEQSWAEADLIQLADWVIKNRVAPSNQHLTILFQVKDSSVESVFRLLVQPVTWAINDRRKNSVDANAVRLIKEILKEDFGITLKVTTSPSDPSFESTVTNLVALLKKVPQHWDHSNALTRRGTPRVNLPPVFRKPELRTVCEEIASMNPRPSSNQVWRAIQGVLPARKGTQADQKLESGTEQISHRGDISEREEITKIASEHIGDSQVSDSALEIGSEDGLNVELIQAATVFRQILTGEEEVAMKVVLHPEFSHLPLQQKAQALEVSNAGEIEKILKSLMSKSKKIASDFELDSEEMNQITVFIGRALMRDGEIW